MPQRLRGGLATQNRDSHQKRSLASFEFRPVLFGLFWLMQKTANSKRRSFSASQQGGILSSGRITAKREFLRIFAAIG